MCNFMNADYTLVLQIQKERDPNMQALHSAHLQKIMKSEKADLFVKQAMGNCRKSGLCHFKYSFPSCQAAPL
eukprot:308385-Amphidinium_carterae.2